MLNAFRHHRGRHEQDRREQGRGVKCSTPFGITEVGTRLFGREVIADHPCSTPFGITEVGTSSEASAMGGDCWCSTPFGITEVGTGSRYRQGSAVQCAQRLSASQRSAPRNSAPLAHSPSVLNAFRHHRGRHVVSTDVMSRAHKCSTPFGITEVGTRERRFPRPARHRVLNAFRHHRGRHP